MTSNRELRTLRSRRRLTVAVLAAGTVATLAGRPALAQDRWPIRTDTLVSPCAPGGTADVLARVLAAKRQDKSGQTGIVENKSGAGGNVGSDDVAKARPDGDTFVLAASGQLVVAPARLFALGAESMSMSPAEPKSFIGAETARWSDAVKASGATID